MPRRSKQLAVRDEFLILTNGKQTEKNYFEAIRAHYKSIFKISVKFMNDDPVALVNHAIAEKTPRNRVWCVFDKDEFLPASIDRAMKTAKENEIGIAFSNMAFEVWLIDHFEKCWLEKNAEKLVTDLDWILKANEYPAGYSKEDKQMIIEVLMPRLDDAVQNADIVMQTRIRQYKESHNNENYPFCDWNSFTNVHKLIDALKLETKNEDSIIDTQ